MKKVKNVSVVIPALNEEKTIEKVISDIESVLLKGDIEFEIIVVDDGSVDNTHKIAKKKKVEIIRHPVSGGYGLSLRDGINKSQYDNIVIIDGDGTYPVNKIPELLSGLSEYDMVVGARKGKFYKESLLKNSSRILLQLICEFVTGRRIPDVNSGLRAFKKDVVLKFKENFCLGFSFTTTITLAFHLNGYFIKYVPIDYYARAGHRGHIKIFRDSLRTAQIITQGILYYNPIKLFILLALAAFIGAAGALAFYSLNGSMLFLIIGSIFLFSSFLYFGMGLIAEEIRNIKRL